MLVVRLIKKNIFPVARVRGPFLQRPVFTYAMFSSELRPELVTDGITCLAG